MRGAVTTLAVVMLVLASCAPAHSARAVDGSVSSRGGARTFAFYEPAAVTGEAPLVIVLHGTPANGRTMESLTGFDAVADRNGFDVAYPNSQSAGTNTGVWDVGCCNAQRKSTDDVQFISDLIDHLVATQRVDPSRVYVVGFSVGGAMTYRLGCELSSKVAAIGSAAGFEYLSKRCAPDRPVSIYQIHGAADLYNGSCGGKTTSNDGCGFGSPGYEPKVHDTFEEWRTLDGCRDSSPARQTVGPVTTETSNGCASGSSVRLDTIAGGGHCYPRPGSCGNFDASAAFWSFFAPHRLSSSPARCVVPDIHGRTLARARELLRRAGCAIGRVNRAPSSYVVLSQSAAPGKHLPARMAIGLHLGPPRRG